MATIASPLLLALQEGSWSSGAPGWLVALADSTPWILTGCWLFLVGRALQRRNRYEAVSELSEVACERVRAAIRRAEERTVGEIVPVVLERSDGHPGACWLSAFITLLLGTVLLSPVLPWDSPGWVIVIQTALGGLGWLTASRLADVQRLFVSDERADEVTEEQALQEFFSLGLHSTEAATGVLLFVSLLEHRVVVMGDTGISEVMQGDAWSGVVDRVLDGISSGDLGGGLVAAIDELGDVLAEAFPWVEGDRNELPDRVIVRRE